MLSKSPQMVTVTLLQGQNIKLSTKNVQLSPASHAVVFSSGVTTLSSPAVDSAATATVVAVVLSVSLLLVAAILLGKLKCELMGTGRIFLVWGLRKYSVIIVDVFQLIYNIGRALR
jgi:hypothetical protein